MQAQYVCEQMGFIGLGLIGASLAQAVRDKGLATRIVAYDKHLPSLVAAKQAGVIDAGDTDMMVLTGCDLIVIATPAKTVPVIFDTLMQLVSTHAIAAECIVTDVCSTKQNVVDALLLATQVLPAQQAYVVKQHFVPAHPIAGAERSGFDARRSDLFVDHKVIVCQLPQTSPTAMATVETLWRAVGAMIMPMSIQHHDTVLAHTSHLPHLLAYTLVELLSSHNDNLDIFRYAAGGFRDFTRIAASDPVMWHDIFIANKTALQEALTQYQHQLQQLKQLINNEDSTALIGLLARAQSARRHFDHMLTATPYTHPFSDSMTTDNTMPTDPSYVIKPQPTTPVLSGSVNVPGDKSISHRSIMLGSLARGVTKISGFLEGEDALATLQAFKDMGVTIEGPTNGEVIIHGVGMDGLKPSPNPLYMGNSGTSMRLLAGILAAQPFDSVLTGDVSLSTRPMNRVATPLKQMGANIQTTGKQGTAPISITGHKNAGRLAGMTYQLPVASAQIKSCLLLAGLWAKGTTTIAQPEITRDHTERMLQAFGYPITTADDLISISGGGELQACDITVPADISSAAFFMVAASIAKDSELVLKQVGINPTRTGVLDVLTLMGADIHLSNHTQIGGEPVADITVKSAPLTGINIPKHLVPLAIDEFPVLFVAASCARGQTVLTGAKELRVKESDRIAVMATGLQTLGIDCTVTDDGIIINGKGDGEPNNDTKIFTGGHIDSHHDHRIAMSFAIASLRAADAMTILGTKTVNTSFPDFAGLANRIGMNITVSAHA